MTTDNSNQLTQSVPYRPGTSGTISGFGSVKTNNGDNLGEVNYSVNQLMDAIRNINNKLNTNFGPSELQKILESHLSDHSNPHRDNFSQLGFNVARDLIGSILPGSVPNTAPVYSIDPLSVIPNNNLPSKVQLPNYLPDLDPSISTGSDYGKNDVYLLYDDDHRNPVSLDDFKNNTSSFGYNTVPIAVLDIGIMGLLCQSPLTIYDFLQNSDIRTDSSTNLSGNSWTINPSAISNSQKCLPTLSVKVNTSDETPSETSLLWYTLTNMPLNKKYTYLIFTTADSSRLVVKYSKSDIDGYPNTVDVVYKNGEIEPVYKTPYSIGGIRFDGKKDDVVTINYTTVASSNWGNFVNDDIGFYPDKNTALPTTYLMKFLGGNPNFLLPYGREVINETPLGLLTSRPTGNNITTSGLNWKLPKLSNLGFKGLMSLSVYIDNVVSDNTPGFKIFDSDCLKINLTVTDIEDQQVSRWDIWSSDNNGNTFITSISGYSGRMQTIAFSFDGYNFRGRVSGSSGAIQLPCKVYPSNLNNASFGNFTGAVLSMEMYDIPDNGYVLDFLVGDGPQVHT